MKLKVEISDGLPDEVVIRCGSMTDEVKLLQDIVSNAIENNAEIVLYSNNAEYYVRRNDILFFETEGGRTTAHTTDKMYYTDYKLYELEKILPSGFVRVSKSCILNSVSVCSINKNLTGASEVQFKNSYKKVYVSRMYFKILKEKINERRL